MRLQRRSGDRGDSVKMGQVGDRTGNINKESGVKDRYGKQEHGIVEVKKGLF